MEVQDLKFLAKAMLVRVTTVLVLIFAWEYSVRTGLLNHHFFASPTEILNVLPYTLTELFPSDMMVTLTEYAAALTIAVLIGLTLGIGMGSNRTFHDVLDPFVGFGMSMPKTVLVPLFILALGIELKAIAFFAASLAVFPIIINTSAGIREVKPEYLTAARSMGHSGFQIFRKVILPSALPTYLTGFFLGSNLAMVGTMIMELMMGRHGLGQLMFQLSYNFRTPELYAVTLLTIIVTTSINGLIWFLSRRMSAWRISQ